MRNIRLGRPAQVAALALLVVTAPVRLATAGQADAQSPALTKFNDAVERYVALHRRLESSVAPADISADADQIIRAPTVLRERLRRARGPVSEGAFFTPQMAALFKRLIRQSYGSDAASLIKATHDEPDELGRALVNEAWPGTALTTMPPSVLAAFPPLPAELEYRFVHRDLVLWDVRADLIVDVLRDAIPAR